MNLAINKGIKELQILLDYMIEINQMRNNTPNHNAILNQVIKRAQGMTHLFEKVTVYHILKGNNKEAENKLTWLAGLKKKKLW